MDDGSKIFNRPLYKMRRARAAQNWEGYNFLKREAADRLADKLADVTRRFLRGLDLGSHKGELAEVISMRVDHITRCDMNAQMQPDIIADEEMLPFAPESFDLIASALSLHHVNDLPGTLIQVLRCLKADGLFLCVLPGAHTLKELRESITHVSAEYGFPLSPRLSPLVEIRDAGVLLQRAGFALPVVDSEMLTVEYESVGKLLRDLHEAGESNILLAQHRGLASRAHFSAIASYYEAHFGEGNTIPATFEFITLTGWKPHSSQQKPSERGSGKVNLNKVF